MDSSIMDGHTMSLMESSSPEQLVINDYKLALKFFVNKDLAQSFLIILKLHKFCYKHFELGTLREEYFIKIVTLYLTEVGLLINPRESGSTYQLSRPEKKELIKQLDDGVYMDNLYQVYGDISKIPLELLFQIFLVYYTCQSVMTSERLELVKQFRKVYTLLDFDVSNDKYLKRWVEMYVFNVLPDADDFPTAFRVAKENPLIDSEKAKTKLEELQELKEKEKKTREKKAEESKSKEAKRLEQEKLRQRKAKDESDLKFKSLKQIRQERERDDSRRKQANQSLPGSSLEQLKHRLSILMKASSNVIQKNSPIILITVLVAFFVSRYLRTRRINIREKILETIKMAFKVTYL